LFIFLSSGGIEKYSVTSSIYPESSKFYRSNSSCRFPSLGKIDAETQALSVRWITQQAIYWKHIQDKKAIQEEIFLGRASARAACRKMAAISPVPVSKTTT
jgi:hypothetical protein